MRGEDLSGECLARICGKSVARTDLLPPAAWGAGLAALRAQRCVLHPRCHKGQSLEKRLERGTRSMTARGG